MKTLLLCLSLIISSSIFSQEYKKDIQPQKIKEDRFDKYHSDIINTTDILKALEYAGIRIFKYHLSPAFEKEYKIDISLNEYINGEKVKTENLYPIEKNTYLHFGNDIHYDDEMFVDYIDQIVFYTKDNDSISSLGVETYAFSMKGTKLKKMNTRKSQFYNWRRYNKIDWSLNEEIPLLVYASSWYDERFDMERFCGIVDLSSNEEETNELLKSSPHYYVITYKIYE